MWLVTLYFLVFIIIPFKTYAVDNGVKIQLLKKVCPVSIVKKEEKIGKVHEVRIICPVCPNFTTEGKPGYKEEFERTFGIKFEGDFEILQIIPIENILFVTYTGCEPHATLYGGYMVFVKDEVGNYMFKYGEPGFPGDCKLTKEKTLICSNSDTHMGITENWTSRCILDKNYRLMCKIIKRKVYKE
jgi:hypothetical protein